MSTTSKLRSIVTSNTYSDIDARLHYNEHINVVPEYFKDITLMGPKGVLVKLYKFTEHTTTRGGLVTQKYKNYLKDSGKPGASLDDFLYQARGVIISVSDDAKKFITENMVESAANKIVPGATVWINPNSGINPANQFLYDRTHPVVEQIDYLTLHPNHIDAVEDFTPLKEIEYATQYLVADDDIEEISLDELSEQDA